MKAASFERSSRPVWHYAGIRYAAACAAAGEMFVLASALGPTAYGRYALVQQVASLLSLIGFGSASGYIYAFFTDRTARLDSEYLSGATLQYAVGALLAGVACYLYRPYLAVAVLVLVCSAPALVTEPMLRVRAHYALPVVAKALAPAMTTLAIGWILFSKPRGYLVPLPVSLTVLCCSCFGAGILYCGLIAKTRFADLRLGWRLTPASLGTYADKMLKPGFAISAASLLLGGLMLVDRLFIERRQPPPTLGTYGLAFQLVQGVTLVLNSINYISSVKIGATFRECPAQLGRLMRRELRLSASTAGVSILLLAAGSMLLERTLYQAYSGLSRTAMIIGSGYIGISVAGSITSLLAYVNRNSVLILLYAAQIGVSVIVNLIAARWSAAWRVPLACTAVCCCISSALQIAMVRREYRKYRAAMVTQGPLPLNEAVGAL